MRAFFAKYWKLLGLALSLVLLGLAFRDVDLHDLGRMVWAANSWLLLVVLLLNFGLIGLKGLRWREIIGAAAPVRWSFAAIATLVGAMASNLLPARGGEVVRVLVLGRQARLSRAMLAGALVVDHLLEGASMVVLMLALPFLLETPGWMRTATASVAGVTVGFAAVGYLLLGAERARLSRWLPERWRPRLDAVMGRLAEGLATLRSGRRLAYVVVLALGIWLFQILMLAVSLRATGVRLEPQAVLFVLMAINVAALIPGAPSSVGPFEFAAVLALGSLGVDKTTALSSALVYHFIQVIPTTLAGLAVLPGLGLRFGDLGRVDGGQSESSKSA